MRTQTLRFGNSAFVLQMTLGNTNKFVVVYMHVTKVHSVWPLFVVEIVHKGNNCKDVLF
jgi:hypothetical protein